MRFVAHKSLDLRFKDNERRGASHNPEAGEHIALRLNAAHFIEEKNDNGIYHAASLGVLPTLVLASKRIHLKAK